MTHSKIGLYAFHSVFYREIATYRYYNNLYSLMFLQFFINPTPSLSKKGQATPLLLLHSFQALPVFCLLLLPHCIKYPRSP